MTLNEFLKVHGSKMGYLETAFLKDVYYPDYGDEGLDKITPEVEIDRNDGTGRKWRIDFVVQTKSRKYAIECDGFSYHAAGMVSKDRFNDLKSKENETIRQGYTPVTMSKDQIVDEPDESIYELRRTFNADEELYSLFLGWNKDKISPHDVQQQALSALQQSRQDGNDRGLVVMATGLGKTYTGIFDVLSTESETILFVVHVDHILKQAKNSFEKVMPERSGDMGFFTGKDKTHKGKKIVFATIQTISKEANLAEFSNDFFDYIIIDESHHSAAESYRKVSDYFNPSVFFLGLTATPDRMDEKSILGYYGDNLVYEMDQSEAIKQGYLASLNYQGFFDNVDYSKIYHNGFRYDVNDLNKLLMIEERDEAVLSKFNSLASDKKTIAFCVSIDHAEWSAKRFREKGIDAVAIHSKIEDANTESAYQSASEIIKAFEEDKHQVVFVVDMLNEGIDIPDVECLLMLRPTESNTILTQQIGRGLRISHGKDEVLVLDFIGNYRTAPRVLSSLGIKDVGELEHDGEKDIYFYDNDGRRVEFQSDVVDIFRFMASRSSREVRGDLITEEWDEYAVYLDEATKEGASLYWSIGKKNNDLSMHVWAISYAMANASVFETNMELNKGMKLQWKATHGEAATMEGIRALFFSKLIGLIKETHPFTVSDAFRSFQEKMEDSEGSAWELISDQIEKYYFYNDISSVVNRHSESGERRQVDKLFHIYPVFFVYHVLLRLGEKGYEDYRISKFEFEQFLCVARDHSEVEDCVDKIVAFREYTERYELEKLLKQRSNMDTRLFKALSYVKYFSYSPEFIALDESRIEELSNKVDQFNKLIEDDKLVRFSSKNNTLYRNMLYSEKNLIDYCSD